MSRVWSCNEWDQLEEVIVGSSLGARYPTADPSTRLAEFPDRSLADIPQGPFPQQIIAETEEDVRAFVEVLAPGETRSGCGSLEITTLKDAGWGVHCITLDTRRKGRMQRYFD
jgi:hypothetical protein